MGVTYTRQTDRARLEARRAALTLGERLLFLTSAVMMLAVALAYAGKIRAEAIRNADLPAPVNLNADTAHSAGALEPSLSAVFSVPADRRAAATAIATHLKEQDLANVGALARLRHEDKPILTSSQLATLKPLVSVRTLADYRSAVMWSALALVLSFHVVSLIWRLRGVPGDRLLLALAHLLVGIGFVIMVTRPDPLRDTLLMTRYVQGVILGAGLFGAISFINLDRPALRELTYLPLAGALLLSVLLLLFGSGPGSSGARVNLGPAQPIEMIRLLLALFLAGYFARRWELLRQVRAESIRNRALPAWINLPRLTHALPVIVGVLCALVLFFFQKDLGPALLLSLIFLSMFAVARGGGWLAGAGVAGLAAGFGLGYLINLSSTLSVRLQMWLSPWDNAARGGDQVAHALWGLAAGATTGTGLGLGSTRFVPEGHTDLVLAGVGEELGLIGLIVVSAAYALIVWRGIAIAQRASSDYRFFLAMALTLSLAIPVLVMAAGALGLLPLTGVVTPFLSFGGSAMAVNFATLGLLVAIGRDSRPVADLAPFRTPVRWLAGTLAAAAVVMLATTATVQAFRADEYLVRPQMSAQADGGRRFTYNPRVLDALRAVPRGTVYDRTGLPIATSELAVATKATGAWGQLGRRVTEECPAPGERCYPGGPAFFHLLGDVNTRANWGAGNSSYVERDAEDLLRGFDDRATTVRTSGADGGAAIAMRRDFSAVVPLVRHRWERNHPAVQAFLARTRDVRLTIDARLQLAVAAILGRAAQSAGNGQAAAIVLDAETGGILASVSYPLAPVDRGSSDPGTLDRGRYGLYPPGSTFKVITAAAALREDPSAHARAYACERLAPNRIGARLPGFGPPVFDDVHDEREHGRIAMHDAIVKSCNAYFAQLAIALGSESLARTAAAAGITLNASASPERVRANLPHAGYGQGEVVATPLRMARVAAAIASDGTIRETPIVAGPASSIATPFVPPAAARLLAADLRDAVVNGTGRQLRDHAARIAGKTGTAELDEAASHAWFIGFAPAGGSRRIAFAVLLEHAGYGGQSAAQVAGQIVTAASTLGLLK